MDQARVRFIQSEQGNTYELQLMSYWRWKTLQNIPSEVKSLLDYGVIPNKTQALVYMLERGMAECSNIYYTLADKPSLPKTFLEKFPIIVEMRNEEPFRLVCNNTGDTFECEKPVLGEIPKEYFAYYNLWRDGLRKLEEYEPDGKYRDAVRTLDSFNTRLRRGLRE